MDVDSGGLPRCSVAGIQVKELGGRDEAQLQRFFERAPDYFIAVNGEPATPTEAREELLGQLPPGWACRRMYWLGYRDLDNQLVAVVNIAADVLAVGVWHIGLLLVDARLHGTGLAQQLHADLEAWAVRNGAQWLRLTVVIGNTKAERFWPRLGYVQVRTREGITMGRQVNRVSIQVKALVGEQLDEYLQRVERDRPAMP
ncbi:MULTISPECIES: GNAT family N-acetyltransferase [Pseudomonas]|uniref:GNAT family N-acetyltransferase n=1 Tax=Pseudomonas TaxID=286 RepID=UPI000CF72F98|nr:MULTISPECIES: GNAT family N-acetyltransferase [Pseudomonas]AVJ37674.1 GNAT family N-acetyltransferase [Pseudomonas lurida]PRA15818.1 GNAT family N-acetyltransferase [Pseudomonas sp. MYb13]PRA18310.1 GNAT family N-acetyltransferase [Pseudomonas lurida]PRA34642.1 GNAT family N-acetyltransferase [Pseudomonas lurida]PRC00092.1 GNAT family N-acetyltransferase [Pseudomonas lurida]